MRTFKNYMDAAKRRKLEETGEEGFSLIELIIVVVILGILVAIAIPLFVNIQAQAQTQRAAGCGRQRRDAAAAAIAASRSDSVGDRSRGSVRAATTRIALPPDSDRLHDDRPRLRLGDRLQPRLGRRRRRRRPRLPVKPRQAIGPMSHPDA